jgi:O-antigen ligase
MSVDTLFNSRHAALLTAGAAGLLCIVLGAALASQTRFGLLLLAAVSGVAVVALVWRLGFVSLVVWVVVSPLAFPFLRIPANHPYVTFDRVWVGAIGVVLLLGTYRHARIVSKRVRRLALTLAWLTAAFLLRAVLNPSIATQAVETALEAAILPLLLFEFTRREARSQERCRQLALALGVGGALLGVIGIAEHYLGFELASKSAGHQPYEPLLGVFRVSGPYPNPEPYALSILMCLAATLYWLQTSRRYFLGATLVALQLGGVAFALFRTGWIGAIIIVIASFGLRPRRFGRLLGVVGLVGAVVFLAFAQLEQSAGLQERVGNTDNAKSRLASYEQGLTLFTTHPAAGVGVDLYPRAAANLGEAAVGGVQGLAAPHSTIVGTMAEMGLWGLLPLLAVIGAIWLLLREFRRRGTGSDVVLAASVVGAAIAYAVMSLVLWMLPYGESNAFFLILLGMVAARANETAPPP